MKILHVISTPNGIGGLLSARDDVVAFADNIRLLLDRRELRERLGSAARENVRRRFDKNRLVDDIRNLYDSRLR